MALGLRQKRNPAFVYNSMSDGELDEGSTWEAAMGAAHHRPRNLICLVDINNQQADGPSGKVLGFEPLADKWAAFGWHVQRVDGNDLAAVLDGLRRRARTSTEAKPRVILFDTLMGKGVPFLEQREKNHFIRVDPPEWQQALADPGRSRSRTQTEGALGMSTVVAEKKPRLTTSAMIASIAAEGQRVQGRARSARRWSSWPRRGPEIVGMTADLAKYTDLHLFAQAYPERFYQMGMAEQLLMAAAGGMAKEGLVPFATTYAVFGTRRAYDFIHQVIAEENLNVKICCALPGLTTGYGPSHQATEDIAMMRGIPGLTIVDPCDALDIEQAVPQIAAHKGPVYMRLLRGNVPLVLDEYDYRFELGKAKLLRDGNDVLVISSGFMTMRALEVGAGPGGRQRRRRGAALPDDQAARRGRDRRGRALQASAGGRGREPLGDRRPRRSGGERAAARTACSRRASSWPGCPTPSSTPARCPRCTTATASAARRWPRASAGWLG